MEWYVGVLKKYAVFDGRARRKEYWMFFLFNYIISFALGFMDGMLGLANDSGSGPLGTIYSLAVLVPAIAVGIRRLHDTGRSGWWLLVPIANLVFLIQDGEPGANKYGPNPKEGAGAYAASAPAPVTPTMMGSQAAPTAYAPVTPSAPAPQETAAPPAANAGAPAAWLADPTGRHEYRYWDGEKWTENVSDAGATAVDPV